MIFIFIFSRLFRAPNIYLSSLCLFFIIIDSFINNFSIFFISFFIFIFQDNDGFVGQEDYKIAKSLDVGGRGYLTKEEKMTGQRILANAFFKKHFNR